MGKYEIEGFMFGAISMFSGFKGGTTWDIIWATTLIIAVLCFIAHDIITLLEKKL